MSSHSPPPRHLEHLVPCPWLPIPAEPLDSRATRRFGPDRGPGFYLAVLNYGQSLWLQGYPARALLLVNRSLGADLDGSEPVLKEWHLPYMAAAWIMQHRAEDQFIGNPRRHYQHLASRMVAPRKALRTWRAWACWFIACRIFPDYPSDEEQIAEEGVVEPGFDEIFEHLDALGIPGEATLWQAAVGQSQPTHRGMPRY
jgi:hypothetical protein